MDQQLCIYIQPGLAIMILGTLIYLIEFKERKGRWSRFFDVFGKNPLFIFVLSGFLPRVLAMFRWVDHVTPEGKKVYTSFFPGSMNMFVRILLRTCAWVLYFMHCA
jgi:predicted acyltransferase